MKLIHKIAIAVILIIILVFIYLIWFRGEPAQIPETLPTDQVPAGGVLPQPTVGDINTTEPAPPGTSDSEISAEEKFVKLSDNPVFDFWVNEGAQESYYITADGKVYSAKEGNDVEISSQPISALNSVESNSKGDRALVAFGNPRSPQWGIFDSTDKAWRPLPSGIVAATWGAKDTEIIAITKNPTGSLQSANSENRVLGTFDISKTTPVFKTILQDMRLRDIALSFVPPTSLYISELPSKESQNRVWLFDTKTTSFNTVRKAENELVIKFSQDRTKTFLGNASQFQIFTGPVLTNIFPVPFKTVPQKCASKSFTVACFTPQNSESVSADSSVIGAYLMNTAYFNDLLYVMNLAADSLDQISVQELNDGRPVDAKNPQIAGNYIYFINRLDGNLYKVVTEN